MAARSRSRRSSFLRAPRGRRLRPWLLLGLGAALAFGAASFLLLDQRVRAQFGDTQWRLPAHVYTRPLEIHDGRQLSRQDVVHHLRAAGYRRRENPNAAGQFALDGSVLRIHTRGFRYPDGLEAAREVSVRFRDGRIASVDSAGAAAIARLEPQRIGRIYAGRRTDRVLVSLEDVPRGLVRALVAVEDRDFFEHLGVQPTAIARALLANLRAGRTVQGGSTLTQQLVKNFFLTGEQTLSRKFTEALMALSLEWHYSKREILEAYLNEVYLGQDGDRAIRGFGLGARFWFGRPLAELELNELALLVGMIKGPAYYDPRAHPERARARRDTVLRVLGRVTDIGPARIETAIAEPLGVVGRDSVRLARYPAYLDLVRRQLKRDYDGDALRTGGLRIFTHLDPRAQAAAERALQERLARLDGSANELQGAVVLAEIDSGAVLATVGDRQVRQSGFNRALRARRPIGSLVKPAVYYTALASGRHTLVSTISDRPLEVAIDRDRTWAPRNYDGEFHGAVPLVDGLVHSYNAATARLGLDYGLDAVGRTLARLGVADADALVPADLLGSLSLTPLQVTGMYQTFAAGGFDAPLTAIAAVQGPDGEVLDRDGLDVRQVLAQRPTFLVNTALTQVARRGTGRALRSMLPGRDLAGKTGTTDQLRDSWFAGFDGRRVGVVWVGRDDNAPAGLTGSAGALRVWADMMQAIPSAPRRVAAPPGIVWARVDPAAGRSLPSRCMEAVRLPFTEGSVPPRRHRCAGDRLTGRR